MATQQPGRFAGRVIHGVVALCVSGAVLGLLAFGYGPVPALGRALDPGRGAWAAAAGGVPVRPQTLTLPGLAHAVSVAFTGHGVPSIRAAGQQDAFLALGYLHARFRLTQMDLGRRLGEGRVAQLAGPAGVSSDEFELRLGLLRTAQAEWAAMPRSGPAAQALLAYSRGVNDYLAQVRADGQWPSIFALAGVYPRAWTPVDSLVLQGVLTQQLDFTTTPLDYALLERSLGPARTMAWFPVLPPRHVPQFPYDPGPYRDRGVAPIAAQASAATVTAQPAASTAAGPAMAPGGAAGAAIAAGSVLSKIGRLPPGLVHRAPDSTAWAADGHTVAGGVAMLAGARCTRPGGNRLIFDKTDPAAIAAPAALPGSVAGPAVVAAAGWAVDVATDTCGAMGARPWSR